jgi:hypothetical protein
VGHLMRMKGCPRKQLKDKQKGEGQFEDPEEDG